MSGIDGLRVSEGERLRRWRLVLGGGDAEGTGTDLAGDDLRIDAAMAAVYDQDSAATAPRWPRERQVGRAGTLGAQGRPMAG